MYHANFYKYFLHARVVYATQSYIILFRLPNFFLLMQVKSNKTVWVQLVINTHN
jgi:hypothetical protein